MDVMAPEKKWTDHRLDDLAKKVDDGVAQADKPLGDFRGEVNARFDKVDERFDKVEGKIEGGIKELRGEMNTRFTQISGDLMALHRILFRASIGAAVAVGVVVIGMLTGHL
jgi:tetrahydromethanopterin S-methyltransferase subunit G